MRKLMVLMVLMVVFLAGPVLAAEVTCISSGTKTSSAVIYAGEVSLCGIRALTNGSTNTTCIVYDNATTNSGTIVGEWITPGANLAGGDNAPQSGVRAMSGLYVAVTTTGGSCIVYYRPGG